MKDMGDLTGRVAVITGGGGGIGAAVCETLAFHGAIVVPADIKPELCDPVVERVKAAGGQAYAVAMNVMELESVKKAFQEVYDKFGRIDILVNNAGVSESTPFGAYTGELFDRVMDLNVKGMFHCARGAVPWMERQGRGVILNTSSMVSFYGQPAGVAYPVSKFAVNGFTLSLARELAPKGIRVNAVAPGIIETDMLRAVPREVLAPLEAQIPLGRVGQPGEVAEAFVFLASEQASYITGVVLRVDGLARA